MKQRHRGKHPEDEDLFSEKYIDKLRKAVTDLSYLYTRNYSEKSAIKIVGDHYQLTERQRIAVQRSACSDQSLTLRRQNEITPPFNKKPCFLIDGYNILITVESMLSGGVLFRGRDRCIRDIASIHGTYRKVEETIPAIQLIGMTLSLFEPIKVTWFLDSPISNSKRLGKLLLQIATERNYPWYTVVTTNPDMELISHDGIVISTDSWVLDHSNQWFNLLDFIVDNIDKITEKTLSGSIETQFNLIDLSKDNST